MIYSWEIFSTAIVGIVTISALVTIHVLRNKERDDFASLESESRATYRKGQAVNPLEGMRKFHASNRPKYRDAFLKLGGYSVRSLSPAVDLFEYRNHKGNNKSKSSVDNVVVHLCGGAFVVFNNSDYLVSDRLLALVEEKCGPGTKLFSVQYSTAVPEVGSLFDAVSKQLLEAFESIIEYEFGSLEEMTNRRVRLTFLGDSAGGNLAINYIYLLRSKYRENFDKYFNNSNIEIKLCLASPWVDLYATEYAPYFTEHLEDDYLDSSYLIRAREHYLSKINGLSLISQAANAFEIKLFSRIFAVELVHRQVSLVVFNWKNCLKIENTTSIKRDDLDSYLKNLSPGFLQSCRELLRSNISVKALVTPIISGSENNAVANQSDIMLADELAFEALKFIFPSNYSEIAFSEHALLEFSVEGPSSGPIRSYISKAVDALSTVLPADNSQNSPQILLFTSWNESDARAFESEVRKRGGIGGGREAHVLTLDETVGFDLQRSIAWIRGRTIGPCAVHDALRNLHVLCQEIAETHFDDVLRQSVYSSVLVEDEQLLDILGRINPLMLPMDRLALLPKDCLVFAGGKEVLLEQILLFYYRLRAAHRGKSVSAMEAPRLIVAPNDVHDYVLLWRHLTHRTLAMAGTAWKFYWQYPHRFYGFISHGRRPLPSDGYVHSMNADKALKEMAEFLS